MVKIKIAIGSKNPVKIKACHNVAEKIWGEVEVLSFAVPSGVAKQPLTEKETIQGAINRAKGAREQGDADYGFGLEGSAVEIDGRMFLTGWVAVVDRKGEMGIGGGGRTMLPKKIAARLKAGEELGPVMDDILNQRNTKQGLGAVGILTGGLKPRQQSTEDSVLYALTRFIRPGLYK